MHQLILAVTSPNSKCKNVLFVQWNRKRKTKPQWHTHQVCLNWFIYLFYFFQFFGTLHLWHELSICISINNKLRVCYNFGRLEHSSRCTRATIHLCFLFWLRSFPLACYYSVRSNKFWNGVVYVSEGEAGKKELRRQTGGRMMQMAIWLLQ